MPIPLPYKTNQRRAGRLQALGLALARWLAST